MKLEQIENVIKQLDKGISKWELDNIVYNDRLSNPKTLLKFLERIKHLQSNPAKPLSEQYELKYLLELLEDLNEEDIEDLYDISEDDTHDNYIEDLAKISAIQVLANGKIDPEILETCCKLNPNDFILCAKRTQDLINTVKNLVIKGENLSKDIPQK